jgi:hypothetical protein
LEEVKIDQFTPVPRIRAGQVAAVGEYFDNGVEPAKQAYQHGKARRYPDAPGLHFSA